MWQTLRDHPEVLYCFVLALVVVLVLTPAVGRFVLAIIRDVTERARLRDRFERQLHDMQSLYRADEVLHR